MSKEKLYYLEIELPKKENKYLRDVTEKINDETGVGKPSKHDFHITVEKPLYCSTGVIRVDLDKWLGMQNSFEFTVDKIDFFKHRKNGLLYLTTNNKEESDMIKDLHYNIHEIIKSTDPRKQNNFDYVPHITLLKDIPLDKIDELRQKFLEKIEPFKIDISEILIKEKDSYCDDWQNIKRCSMGGDSTFSYQSC